MVLILARVSDSFFLSIEITCSGAFSTNLLLDNFFWMPNKKPSALFNSLFNFNNSASISMLSIANGTKYSFDFTLNDAPSTFSVTSFILVVLVNFEIMSSN